MSVDGNVSKRLALLVLAATLCSAFALLGVLVFDTHPTHAVAAWLLVGVVCLGGHLGLRRAFGDREPTASPLIVLAALTPVAWQFAMRLSGGSGFPGEVLMILIAQAIGCGLAMVAFWRPYQPMALVCGLFVILFSMSVGTKSWSVAGAGGYTLAASMWLAANHWSVLERRMTASERTRPRLSRWLPVALTLVILAAFAGARFESLPGLSGFVWSSGGDRGADPSARQGVGEGDMLVAGTDRIQTFGPIEDAPFASGKDPSLYDVFNELYDEPVRNSQTDRSIALTADQLKEIKSRMAKSEQASRDFSLVRKPRGSGPRAIGSLSSTALFYVKGRTPLHLRHDVYDLFDGTAWYAIDDLAEDSRPKLHPRRVADHTWLHLPGVVSRERLQGPIENHALKFSHFKSNRLPAPLELVAIHIRELSDPEMFRCIGGQRLQIARESIPALTPIHLRSRTVRLSEVDEHAGPMRPHLPAIMALPATAEMARLKPLAEAWTANVPRGIRQIQRVMERLKTECQLERLDDSNAVVVTNAAGNANAGGNTITNTNAVGNAAASSSPVVRNRDDGARSLVGRDESATPVSRFLFETRRGRDYDFATAGALLLRTLGYPTRLVAGFYASPENFDPRKQHTPVFGRDAHVWLEVSAGPNLWITVDPSPGFEVLAPPLTPWENVLAFVADLRARLWSLRLEIVSCACLAIGLWWSRRIWLDWLAVWMWRLVPARSERDRVLQTLRLIDQRLAWRGYRRPTACSPHSWYSAIPVSATDNTLLCAVARLADWAVFAPESHPPPYPSHDIGPLLVAACRAVDRLHAIREPARRIASHDRARRSQTPSALPSAL